MDFESREIEKYLIYQAGEDVSSSFHKLWSENVKKNKEIVLGSKKDAVKLWTFTVKKDEEDPIEKAYELGSKFVKSKLSKIIKYVACVERGDDNDNWHCHLMVYHDGYVDFKKVKNLKVYKDRKIDVRVVTPTIKSLENTLRYVVKGYNKYPEVDSKYGSSIFANFDIKKNMVYDEFI